MSSDHEIVSSRWIAAPVERVFASFTDPKVLEKWWGPEGFTNEVTKFEFLVGGEWEITMRSPDGTEFPNVSRFVEIVPDEKIIYDHIEPVHAFTMIMTFDGKDGC